MTTVADNLDLRRRRKILGLSLDVVAMALGCDVGTLSRFERGYRQDLPGGKTREDYDRYLRSREVEGAA